MTQREIVVRLCEAYVKAGQTVEIGKIIKIADYIMAHTCDSSYSTPIQYVNYMQTTTDPYLREYSTCIPEPQVTCSVNSIVDTANTLSTSEDVGSNIRLAL